MIITRTSLQWRLRSQIKMKTLINISAAIVTSLVALPSLAATVSLVPSTTTVSEGGQFTVDLVMDAADADGNHPGSFRGKIEVDFDALLVDYVGFVYNSPAVEFGTTTISEGSVELGFDQSEDVATIGTFTFDALGSAGSTISFGLGDAQPLLGSFFNTDGVVKKFEPAFNGAEVSVVPIPAAAWLMMSALGILGGLSRRRS
jgi:hypothetical protein